MKHFTFGSLLLVCLWLTGAQVAKATDEQWLMVTDNGTKLEMENVASLVLTDDAETFDILDFNGGVVAAKVKKVTFEPLSDNINAITPRSALAKTELLSHAVSRQLTIVGSQGEAVVYSAAGVAVASGMAVDGETTIDVARLPQGTYLVRSGKQAFKFIKK
jgi:hypothetical protein